MEWEDTRLRILFLDKEGGYGGSSRSLYFLIRNLDRRIFLPVVLLKERGPAMELYRKLGVRTTLLEVFPTYKPSLRKNLWVLSLFLLRVVSFWSSCRFLLRFIAENRIDIIHMNHDSFFLYGFLLRRFSKTKIVFHMRTMLPLNGFGAFQAKCIERIADRLIFISENECNRYEGLLRRKSKKGTIIFNPAAMGEVEGLPPKPKEVFLVLYLGNLTYNKGSDRLIDIAVWMKSHGVGNIVFLVCGEDRGSTKGNVSIAEEAERTGVQAYFRFLGHQAEPERFLENADILIRLSRWNDPWGRDIIEAMSFGKPVIATGTYDRFVEQGINGFLHQKFDAGEIAKEICFLAVHPEVVKKIGRANHEKAKRLFDEAGHASRVMALYDETMEGSARRGASAQWPA